MTHQPLRGWCLPADELVEIFGLSARADASPLSLSSGQRQRLSLAAALARPSRLLLLDEPEQSPRRRLPAGTCDAAPRAVRGQRRHGRDGDPRSRLRHRPPGARIVSLAEGRIDGEAGRDHRGRRHDRDPSHDRRAGDRRRHRAGQRRGRPVVPRQAPPPELGRLVRRSASPCVIAAIYGSDFLATPLSRLSKRRATPPPDPRGGDAGGRGRRPRDRRRRGAAPARAGARPAGALPRRRLLAAAYAARPASRPAASGTGDRRAARHAWPAPCSACSRLAMAGPYLRLSGSGLPGSWLFLSAVAGAGCCLAAVPPRRSPSRGTGRAP